MNKLKPFNLERALAGDDVVTRDGRKVLQLFYFDRAPIDWPYALVAAIEGESELDQFTLTGKWMESSENVDTGLDLFMAPKKKKLWIKVDKDGNDLSYYTSRAYVSLEALKFSIPIDRGQIVEVEIDDE